MERRRRIGIIDRAESLCWALLPAAVLFSISAGQALAALLVGGWLWRLADARAAGRRTTDVPRVPAAVTVPLAAFLCWAALAAFLAVPEAPDLGGALGKWLFALTLPAAWAHARRTGEPTGAVIVLLAAGIALLPWGLRDFLASEGGRAGGFSGSGPHLGSNLMMGFVIALGLAFSVPGPSRWLMAACALLLLSGVGLSLNRSALLGAMVGAGILCARNRPMLLAAALGLLALGLTAYPISKPALRLRGALLFDVNETARERAQMWQGACRMVRDRPFTGFTSRTGFADAYSVSYRSTASLEPRPGHVHNSYLHTAVLHGIPGLGLLLWWLASLWTLASRSRGGTPMMRDALIPLLAAVLVNALFDFVLADGQHALMWYSLAGLGLGASAYAGIPLAKPASRIGRRG